MKLTRHEHNKVISRHFCMCVCAVFGQPKQTSLLNQNIAGPNLCQVDCDI